MAAARKVYVQQTIDEAVYFTTSEIEYESVPVPSTIEGHEDSRVVFVRFTPTNGYDKGKEHSVPISRVIAIVGDDDAPVASRRV